MHVRTFEVCVCVYSKVWSLEEEMKEMMNDDHSAYSH